MEVLEHTPTTLRRGTTLALIALVGLVVMTIAAVLTDQWRRGWESAQITAASASALATADAAHSRVRGTVAYASPLLQVGPPAVRADLEALVEAEVESGLAAVDQARQVLLDITVWPWHGDIIQQRARLIAQLDEQVSSTLRRASDPRDG
jgi:hypothetical protein